MPAGFLTTIVAPVTAWSKPTETFEFVATLTAPGAGDCEITVGRAAVVKVHETGAIGPLPTEAEPETVTV